MTGIYGCLLFGSFISGVLCDSGKCGTKLLNDYNKVPDSAFSATSHFIHTDPLKKRADFSAKAARESYDKENQEFAWCPRNQVKTSLSEYIEIDLGRLTMVKVVQTKGRFAQGAGKEFTPFYRIRYSRDSGVHWRDYKKFKDKGFQDILNGPNDAFLDAFETLHPPIVARIVRIFPYSLISKRVCLKLQLFGCDFENNLLEYRMLQGTPAMISNSILSSPIMTSYSDVLYPCLDNGYDGYSYEGLLQDGLGLLTDNLTGGDVTNKSKELFDFVGWKKDKLESMKEFVSIKFLFINSRNFSSVRIHSYSNHAMQIEFFSQIHMYFSDDNKLYSRRLIKTDLGPHFVHRDFFIDINLQGQFGRFVKMNIYFQSTWLLLSEISFTSDSSETGEKNSKIFIYDSRKATIKFKSKFPTNVKRNDSDYHVITTTLSKQTPRSNGLEIIYLLAILLCLLLGVITAICSFWIIIKRKRFRRKNFIKKQAMALSSQTAFIPYNHHSNSVQCLTSSVPATTIAVSRGNYPAYTVDRRNYPNGTLREASNVTGGYSANLFLLDQDEVNTKHCNGDTNVYTSIVGSEDSTLSPEYATTSVTNDPIFSQTYAETPATYLPLPIEPIRTNSHNDSCASNSDRQSKYYTYSSTLSSPQDPVNIWRINNTYNANIEPAYGASKQSPFSDFSYPKFNDVNMEESYTTNNSSKYTELPFINSHF